VIITRVGQEQIVDVDSLWGAVTTAFPGRWRTWDLGGDEPMMWAVEVSPAGQHGFVVQLNRRRTSVHCDGQPEQCAAVAAAVAQVAAGSSRLIGFGGDWEWHVDLFPGITPEQVLDGQVVHDEHWSDPELENS
jgi:hypothetical protein